MTEVKSKIRAAVTEFPLFRDYEEKARFFLVLGLLLSRQISFPKAAELAGLSREELSLLLIRETDCSWIQNAKSGIF